VRIVITGASGNVGTALVERLLPEGHELVGIARRPPAPDTPAGRSLTWHAVDLARGEDETRLRTALVDADAVVHLAWGFQPSHRPDLLRELGVGGTQRVSDAVASVGVRHLVHMSSVGAYSPKTDDHPVPEAYPTDGVPTSPYSQHKAAAERLLDGFEREHPGIVVTRMRPGIVGQRDAGSALLRYGVPGFVPPRALRMTPVLPFDRSVRIPMVHAADVADAIARVLESRAPGAFNLSAPPDVTAQDIAAALRARLVPLPARVLRAGVSLAWHGRLLQLDPGWIDLAFAVPLLDTTRARTELGWTPTVTGPEVLEEVVTGMSDSASARTPVLRPRRIADQVRRAVREGPVSLRRRT
jgi:nucleoside-diphosphate-sugar epimerase